MIPEAPEKEEQTINDTLLAQFQFPVDPSVVKENPVSDKFLTDYEKTEIDEYEQLFFIADNELKIKPTKLERLVNNGFDDEEGYYRV